MVKSLLSILLFACLLLQPLVAESAFAGRIVAWGYNYDGQCDAPKGDDFVAIAAGRCHSLALRADGSLVAWGRNDYGQCNVPKGNDFKAIAAGYYHCVALKSDGSLVAWGNNRNGQCNVPAGNDFVAITAHGWHCHTLKSDSSFIPWGNLGYIDCANHGHVRPTGKGFKAIASGYFHGIAIRNDDSVIAWGADNNGQCVVPKDKDFVTIDGGVYNCLAIKSDGSLVGWGGSQHRQSNVPEGKDFKAIAAGYYHGLAIKSDGLLVAWGDNNDGQCDVPEGRDFIAIAGGGWHSLAISSGDSVAKIKKTRKQISVKPSDSLPARMVFVENGRAKAVREFGQKWKRGDGYLECTGKGYYLVADKAIGKGDFHIRIRMSLERSKGTGALFVIGTSHFGFDKRLYVEENPIFSNTNYIDEATTFITPGKPFDFEVIRSGSALTFLIDGKEVHKTLFSGAIGRLSLRPWTCLMRVYDFSAAGNLVDPRFAKLLPTMPKSYSIPIIDISQEKWRHVIVDHKPGHYLGHPKTVLLADNKTMFCTYPLGHGGPPVVIKKSTDGGLTWSERLDVPENWKEARNCPCIHRLTDPDGVERLIVLSGGGRFGQAISEDSGETWSSFKPNGLSGIVPPITIEPISGNRYLMLYELWTGPKRVLKQAISSDGGLTWHSEREIFQMYGVRPGEPAIVRSPDGKQLIALIREQSRQYNSLMIVSNDEGKTWPIVKELSASLSGDRHSPRYSHDGRLVVTFRDTAAQTPTGGHFVAWVGTYDDIINGREGQYRIKLLHAYATYDCGYAGLELLPDGTFVATTYIKYWPDDKRSVVSTRFKLEEIDARAASL